MPEKVNNSQKERYNALDGLRALACIGIVAMHVQANMATAPTENWWTASVIGFSWNFVLMFMMVSAFALNCGYYHRFKDKTISMSDFYRKRYIRILPFFLLLILIDILKTAGQEHFAFTEVMKGELFESFADATLMFGLLPGNGIEVVGVGWFLGIIFLFYVFYPFFTFMLQTKRSAWISLAVIIGLYFCAEEYFVPSKGVSFGNTNMICCAPFFMCGGLIYLYRMELKKLTENRLTHTALGIFTICYTAFFYICPECRFTFANCLMYSLWLIYAVCEINSLRKNTFLNNSVMHFLSNVSMEVYLCHMMMFRIVEKLHLEKNIGDNDINYYVTFGLVLSLAVIFAWMWKRWCEPRIIRLFD